MTILSLLMIKKKKKIIIKKKDFPQMFLPHPVIFILYHKSTKRNFDMKKKENECINYIKFHNKHYSKKKSITRKDNQTKVHRLLSGKLNSSQIYK